MENLCTFLKLQFFVRQNYLCKMKRESNETVENAKRESNSTAAASGATNGVTASATAEINGHQGPQSNDSKTSSNDSKTPRLQDQNGHPPSQPPQSQSTASTSSPGENRGFKLTQAPTGAAIDTVSLNALQQKTTTPAHKKKEIYRYTGKDPFYGCAWSNKYMGDSFRIAVCTCLDDAERFDKNRISILEYDEYKNELIERCNFEHGFPATSMMMNPSKNLDSPEILATASNGLKIFRYDRTSQSATLEATMISKPYNMSAAIKDVSPYTCLDWLEVSPEYIATSCIDSTCSIWNIEYGVELSRVKCSIKTQLIAHEKSVNAIAFSNLDSNREQFATASEDGSVRLFDARNLEHSTILYDDPKRRALNHIAWNKQEPYTIAILPHGSMEVLMIDIRRLQIRDALAYNNHNAVINAMAWAPHSSIHHVTCGADSQALIWQTDRYPREEPILAYKATGEITNVKWSRTQSEWIAICFGNCVEVLRV